MGTKKVKGLTAADVEATPDWMLDGYALSNEDPYVTRDYLEREPITTVISYGMHCDRDEIGRRMPDKTMDQLMLKCAFAHVTPEVKWDGGWLIVNTPWGSHCFIVDADGSAFSSFQVL